MSFFANCFTVFIILTAVIIGLFEGVMYPDMPLPGNVLFGSFAAIMVTIFYGWMFDMFFRDHASGIEE